MRLFFPIKCEAAHAVCSERRWINLESTIKMCFSARALLSIVGDERVMHWRFRRDMIWILMPHIAQVINAPIIEVNRLASWLNWFPDINASLHGNARCELAPLNLYVNTAYIHVAAALSLAMLHDATLRYPHCKTSKCKYTFIMSHIETISRTFGNKARARARARTCHRRRLRFTATFENNALQIEPFPYR